MQATVTQERGGHRGFTLIELLVTMSIAAIVLAIGAPSLRDVIADQRVRIAASDLTGEIAYARAEAVSRGRRVAIEPLTAGNWPGGWRIYADTDGSGTFNAGDAELKRSPGLTGNIKICTNVGEFANNVVFRPDGRVVRTSATGANDGITISDDLGNGNAADDKIRTLYFGPSGRITVVLQNGGANSGVACP
jgi:type IV fimbrial biogenesis protein FimT